MRKIFDPQISQISADYLIRLICVNLCNLRIKFFLSEAKESGRFFERNCAVQTRAKKRPLSSGLAR